MSDERVTLEGSLDRIEEGLAVIVLEPSGRVHVPAELLPASIAPGDAVTVTIARDRTSTRALQDEVARLQRELLA